MGRINKCQIQGRKPPDHAISYQDIIGRAVTGTEQSLSFTDGELMEGLANGRMEALGEFYSRHGDWVEKRATSTGLKKKEVHRET